MGEGVTVAISVCAGRCHVSEYLDRTSASLTGQLTDGLRPGAGVRVDLRSADVSRSVNRLNLEAKILTQQSHRPP